MFPGGVPGVPQGVPPELVKGYQPPPEPAAGGREVAEEKPKPAEAEAQRRSRPRRRAPAPATAAASRRPRA